MAKNKLKNLEVVNKDEFCHDLIGWFEEEQRDLPWRKDQDPYKVWVSEIMLAANTSGYSHSLFQSIY